jgi:hypothetical protein
MGIKSPAVAFEQKYGLPLREFFLVLMCIYQRFEIHVNSNTSPLRFEIYEYLKPHFTREDIEKALPLVSSDPYALAYNLMSAPRQNWAADLQALRERPVLRISPEHFVCPDFGLLYRCLTDRIYHLLEGAYEKRAFSQLFGFIFEEYVNGLIRQFAYEGSTLVRNFYASPFFEGTTDQAGDGILHWEDSAVLMEYKARQLTTRERYAGIQEVLMSGIDDILGKEDGRSKKGVTQLASNIKRLLAGEKVVAGSGHALDLSRCPTIYPMIVSYDDAMSIEAVRQYAEANFRVSLQKRGGGPSRVSTLFVFSLKDFETLEALTKKIPPKQLLSEYADHIRKNPKDRLGSFRNFVVKNEYGDMARFSESCVGQTQARVLQEVFSELERRKAEMSEFLLPLQRSPDRTSP